MTREKKNVMYHNQATKDRYADIPDLKKRIIETTMKEILESYNEYLDDLRMEAQEAY